MPRVCEVGLWIEVVGMAGLGNEWAAGTRGGNRPAKASARPRPSAVPSLAHRLWLVAYGEHLAHACDVRSRRA
eukprot:2719416-Rhodomonas_salina.3